MLGDSRTFSMKMLISAKLMLFYRKMCIFAKVLIFFANELATILHIETSTDVCSVSLSKDGFCLYEASAAAGAKGSQAAEKLATMTSEALGKYRSATEGAMSPLDAVAVSSGPGSYTGLRIGMSMAKGLAYGNDAKLIAVPTLELLCVPVLLGDYNLPDEALLCPMIDARRMEVYTSIYDRALKAVRPTEAVVVDGDTFADVLNAHQVYFFGNGAGKCMDVINHPNAHYIDGIEPLAKNMMPLADKRFHNQQFEDVAYFTPEYYKEYQAKLPKIML